MSAGRQGALLLHGRNPLFVPCSAYVCPNAALALVDASAVGLMSGSLAARGFAPVAAVMRPEAERIE